MLTNNPTTSFNKTNEELNEEIERCFGKPDKEFIEKLEGVGRLNSSEKRKFLETFQPEIETVLNIIFKRYEEIATTIKICIGEGLSLWDKYPPTKDSHQILLPFNTSQIDISYLQDLPSFFNEHQLYCIGNYLIIKNNIDLLIISDLETMRETLSNLIINTRDEIETLQIQITKSENFMSELRSNIEQIVVQQITQGLIPPTINLEKIEALKVAVEKEKWDKRADKNGFVHIDSVLFDLAGRHLGDAKDEYVKPYINNQEKPSSFLSELRIIKDMGEIKIHKDDIAAFKAKLIEEANKRS